MRPDRRPQYDDTRKRQCERRWDREGARVQVINAKSYFATRCENNTQTAEQHPNPNLYALSKLLRVSKTLN